MKARIILTLIIFYRMVLAQPLLTPVKYCPDTSHVWKELVWPSDSLVSTYKKPICILNFNDLLHFLKPESRYKKINIDFSRQYIVCNSICPQCAASCPPDFPECHRNSCRYIHVWKLAERERTHELDFAFTTVNTTNHPDTLVITRETTASLSDSIPEFIYLYRTVSGDCHALNRHQVYRDEKRKTITWTVHHVYGGCAAMLYEPVYIRIKNPGAGYTFVFDETKE